MKKALTKDEGFCSWKVKVESLATEYPNLPTFTYDRENRKKVLAAPIYGKYNHLSLVLHSGRY